MSRAASFLRATAVALLLFVAKQAARANDDVPSERLPDPQTVVARIGDDSIYAADVYGVLDATGEENLFEQAIPKRVLAAALAQAIDQHLILKQLERQGLAPEKEEVEESIGALKAHVEAGGQKWNEYLAERRMNDEAARRRVRWTKAWAAWLEEHATDEALQKMFAANAREFDGTRLHARHILFKAAPGDKTARAAARAQATALRARIAKGEFDFAAAAREQSDGASRKGGGDIGWVGRMAPMPDAFSRALFALKKEEVGGPVETRAGVHLIQWTESEPGKRTWQEARTALRDRFAFEQFSRIAREERGKSKVESTGALPETPR